MSFSIYEIDPLRDNEQMDEGADAIQLQSPAVYSRCSRRANMDLRIGHCVHFGLRLLKGLPRSSRCLCQCVSSMHASFRCRIIALLRQQLVPQGGCVVISVKSKGSTWRAEESGSSSCRMPERPSGPVTRLDLRLTDCLERAIGRMTNALRLRRELLRKMHQL